MMGYNILTRVLRVVPPPEATGCSDVHATRAPAQYFILEQSPVELKEQDKVGSSGAFQTYTLEYLDSEDQSLSKTTKRVMFVPTPSPPLQVPGVLALSDSEKAEALTGKIEAQFQPATLLEFIYTPAQISNFLILTFCFKLINFVF
jgi:hypothetical protein